MKNGQPAFPVAVSAEGQFRWLGERDEAGGFVAGAPARTGASALIAVIRTDDGQAWLPLEEFTHRYGWTNDPAAVPTFAR